jgi:hypothetical protein
LDRDEILQGHCRLNSAQSHRRDRRNDARVGRDVENESGDELIFSMIPVEIEVDVDEDARPILMIRPRA